MTISVLQVASVDPVPSATTTALAFGSNITAGSWIVGLTMTNFTTFSGVTDTLGNTLTLRQTALSSAGPGNQKLYAYAGRSASGGADTVTFTYASSTSFRPAYLLEIAGASVAAYDGGNNNDQTAPTTGTDAVVSGSAANASQPALIIGVSVRLSSTVQAAVGTGFTAQSGNWGGGSAAAVSVETKRITTAASQQATWTAAGNTEHLSLMIMLDEFVSAANFRKTLSGIGTRVGARQLQS